MLSALIRKLDPEPELLHVFGVVVLCAILSVIGLAFTSLLIPIF